MNRITSHGSNPLPCLSRRTILAVLTEFLRWRPDPWSSEWVKSEPSFVAGSDRGAEGYSDNSDAGA